MTQDETNEAQYRQSCLHGQLGQLADNQGRHIARIWLPGLSPSVPMSVRHLSPDILLQGVKDITHGTSIEKKTDSVTVVED